MTINWREREKGRLESGEYRELPWALDPWWLECWSVHADHYAHLSKDRDGKIAFTESPEKGEADRQLRMKPGRYLNRYFAHYLTPDEIRELAASVDTAELLDDDSGFKLATTPDEIERVYRGGPRSCMSGASAECTRVYGAGDLAIAYTGNIDKASGRVLVWPEHKVYGRVYGDDDKLTMMLERAGYDRAGRLGFVGARLLAIDSDHGGYVGPYFDGGEMASYRDGYLVLEEYGEYPLNSTEGTIGGMRCYGCEDFINEDDSYYANDEHWCPDCYTERFFYCESCDETCDIDESVCVDDSDYICSHCAQNSSDIIYCDACDNYSSDWTTYDDGEVVCDRCFERGAVECSPCEDCGDNYTELAEVKDSDGDDRLVCAACSRRGYTECAACGEWWADDCFQHELPDTCDACIKAGAEELLVDSEESYEFFGTLLLPARAASLTPLARIQLFLTGMKW